MANNNTKKRRLRLRKHIVLIAGPRTKRKSTAFEDAQRELMPYYRPYPNSNLV